MRYLLRAVALVTLMTATAEANPVVTVTVTGFGTWVFEGDQTTAHISATEVQPLHIAWQFSASHDGATIVATRSRRNGGDWSGWDAPWEQCWSVRPRCYPPPRFFRPGMYQFDLQVQDSNGGVTMASLVLDITPVSTEAASWSDLKQRYRD